jgi:hypothetical protein
MMVKAASLLALVAVLAPAPAVSAQPGSDPVYQFDGRFDHNRLEIGLDYTHALGEPARPGQPLESFEFSVPDESRFFGPRIGFCFSPDACPAGSRIGSGEITYNFGSRGSQVFDAGVFNARGGFFFVPFRAYPAPSAPLQLPPPIFFDKAGNSFTGELPSPFCPDPGASACDPSSLAFAMGLDVTLAKRAVKPPEDCPRSRFWRFEAAVNASTEELRARMSCIPIRQPFRCTTTVTVFGPVTDNMGNRFSNQTIDIGAICNRKVEEVRVVAGGSRIRACDDGQGGSCRITTTVVEDDTSRFDVVFPKGRPGSVSISADPEVQPGTELRFEFIGPAGVLETEQVM